MKIVHLVGNRPQFIKLAILENAFKKYPQVKQVIVHTGQHFDTNMSDIFFDELAIPAPSYHLQINKMTHGAMLGHMLIEIEIILLKEKPDWVVVFGDTNTTLAGAIAAKKLHIKLAHIESGVRTFNEEMPEESNRYLSDRLADINFCCTADNAEQLKKEGYGSDSIRSAIINSGDIMLDATIFYKDKISKRPILDELGIKNEKFVLATIHRAENTENITYLKHIISALNKINTDTKVILLIHPNTKNILLKENITASFTIVDALGYLDTQALLNAATYVITDSGGLSREAFFYNKPTVIIMQRPFWPEIIANGNCLLAQPSIEDILHQFSTIKQQIKQAKTSLFGTGNAAAIIAEAIVKFSN
ncbi:MAG TPA: UDP-N-acetylglucosamine 2-epimerase (non-hydrolyzing) [Ferruginibacter sp.]|nr:UDP-N-acetylglucosamine 2-epimerase (non-hydrolyzing) [Ferruginibacter sp.]